MLALFAKINDKTLNIFLQIHKPVVGVVSTVEMVQHVYQMRWDSIVSEVCLHTMCLGFIDLFST